MRAAANRDDAQGLRASRSRTTPIRAGIAIRLSMARACEIAICLRDNFEDASDKLGIAKAAMCVRAVSIKGIRAASIAVSSSTSPIGAFQSGTAPPQFLATMVSERCARLPMSLARSAFMRATIASCE